MAPSNDHERRVTGRQAQQLDSRPDRWVAALAAEAWSVLSVHELHACGLSDNQIAARVAGGRLHPWYRGVYVIGHANPPLEGRWLAAVKACGPAAVLSHYAAAALWRLVDWDGRYPAVTVRGSGTRVHHGIRVHRSSLASADITRHRGIPVTSPLRTLLDLAAIVPARTLRRAVRQALALRLVHHGALVAAVTSAGRRRGIRALRAILADGPAPTRSALEDVVLDLILRTGLRMPDINVALTLDGRRVIPDFRWPALRLVVEADGAAWHDDPLARADDAERQALLEEHGERVLRVSWRQAVGSPAQTLARIAAAASAAPARSRA
jgi:very-short-patch-repair endonuclease